MILQQKLCVQGAVAAIALSLGSLMSCATTNPAQAKEPSPFNWVPANPDFRTFYGWDGEDGSWKTEKIANAEGGAVAIHIFRPHLLTRRRGTVFFLHGYLEHSALQVRPILEFVKRGWVVVGIDLPGHGLSTGKRADIDDFSSYLAAFEAAMAHQSWQKPWRAVGHSTGGATILMAMQNPARNFDLVVLEAPLIRTYMWSPSLWLKNIVEDWIVTVPRRPGSAPDGDVFQQLLEDDPFYIAEVPLHWVDAVEEYYRSTSDWLPVRGRALILQGKKDTVVDVAYNLPFLEKLLPDADIVEIEEGRHHLLMDGGQAGEDARRELFARW